MIDYTQRLDAAIRKTAWAHDQAGQYRKGGDIPYVIHPVGVMMIASNATDDEDILIACLMHDVLEDVDASIYSEAQMKSDYGERVVAIVNDVTKDDSLVDWHARSKAYLHHLEHEASSEAVIVSASDKIHNLMSILADYEARGDKLWKVFTTRNSADQLWWYESILAVITKRDAPKVLVDRLGALVAELQVIVGK